MPEDVADETPDARADRPPPPGYRRVYKPNNLLIGAGMSLLFLAYVPALVGGALGNDFRHPKTQSWLLLPVVGPFMFAPSVPTGDQDGVILDGFVQAIGAGLLLVGAFSQVPVLIREKPASVELAPLFLPAGGAGLQARATF